MHRYVIPENYQEFLRNIMMGTLSKTKRRRKRIEKTVGSKRILVGTN